MRERIWCKKHRKWHSRHALIHCKNPAARCTRIKEIKELGIKAPMTNKHCTFITVIR